MVDTDGHGHRGLKFNIFQATLQLQPPKKSHCNADQLRNTPTQALLPTGSLARAVRSPARPCPRACITAHALPLRILTSPPEIIGGLGLVAPRCASNVATPALRDRSIGIAAAQAFAFTTSDPGACTPPWTLQGNTRQCVVDTDGRSKDGGSCKFFNPFREGVTLFL